jgi:hypothetical protein
LAKLVAVVVVAGVVGVGLGVALSTLSGGDDDPSPPATSGTTATARATTSVPATTTPAASPADDSIEVTVGRAVLHLASTPSGKARNRARLGVRVTVRNRGTRRVVLPRPSLLTPRQRIASNPAADAGGSRLGPIAAGQTKSVTLQFETAGAVTRQLTTQRRARVLVGAHSSPVTVTPG